MDIENLPKELERLSDEIDRLSYALLLAGICPRCGSKVTTERTEKSQNLLGYTYSCSCGAMTFLSDRAVFNLKHGRHADDI